MSKELTELQRKRQQAEEELNRAYRIVFVTEKPSQTALKAARKRVRQDLDDIMRAISYLSDKNGEYPESVIHRGLINEGGRKIAEDMLKRISSKPDSGMEKKKIKVTK